MSDKDKDLNERWVDKALNDVLRNKPGFTPRHRYHKHILSSVGLTRFYFASFKDGEQIRWYCPFCEEPEGNRKEM
jgi:hypothetical protein